MTSPTQNALTRQRERHEFAIRTLTVSGIRDFGPRMRRVTFTGPLEGFTSTGPGDHTKVFFPDPETGELHAPSMTPTGMQRPEGVTIIGRDYTPLPTADGMLELDFVLHGDTGPASHWAERAAVGDQLVVAGPRGSHLPPAGVDRYVIGGDETALPAISRWIAAAGTDAPVTAIIEVAGAEDEVYPLQAGPNVTVQWLHRGEHAQPGTSLLAAAVRAVGDAQGETPGTVFWWFAGESNGLIPVRRYLRRELGLDKSAVDINGYWRQGAMNFNHHEPIDPDDPED